MTDGRLFSLSDVRNGAGPLAQTGPAEHQNSLDKECTYGPHL